MFTGQNRNEFRVSSHNPGDGKTFNQSQLPERQLGEVAFLFCFESGLELKKGRNGGMKKKKKKKKKNRSGMLHL